MWRMVIVLVIMGLCVHTAVALSGSGTQQDPYRIQSLADFDEFAADPNYWSGFTRLETDVNLAGRTYTTAVIAPDVDNSNYDFDGTPFTGVFDGNEHKLIGLTINGGVNHDVGLFGCIVEDGQVNNLGLEGGSVSGHYSIGGLVGKNGEWPHPGGAITNCYSTGDVSGNYSVGGLVGENYDGTLSNCYSTGDVSGYEVVGGLVGDNSYGSISNCHSTSDVNGVDEVGGLVGSNSGSVSNCYSTGDVSGYCYVGGLVGYNARFGSISNCYSTGDVSGSTVVGGLVGHNSGTITNCYSSASVIGSSSVGGLAGVNSMERSPGTISNCHSTGFVSGDEDVGGLVGGNGGSVLNCYSIGSVSGDVWVGGLVGGNYGSISNCYSTGSVTGDWAVGGLVGWNQYGDIVGSFWDVNTSGWPTSAGGTGKTTAEMKTKSTFTNAGWDFVEIWLINDGATYPVLRQEIRSDLNGDGGVDMVDFALFADHWLEGKVD